MLGHSFYNLKIVFILKELHKSKNLKYTKESIEECLRIIKMNGGSNAILDEIKNSKVDKNEKFVENQAAVIEIY